MTTTFTIYSEDGIRYTYNPLERVMYDPLNEQGIEDGGDCHICGKHYTGDDLACTFGTCDGIYCPECLDALIDKAVKDGQEYARQHCKITLEDDEIDLDEIYTAHARHNYTNYDELLETLDRCDVADTIFYEAIRSRIVEILEKAAAA